MAFVNLHQHSNFSLLDSNSKPKDMVKKAKELYGTLCLSDHGVIFNAPEVYLMCKDAGVGYIYACELYICKDKNIKDTDDRYNHLLALAYTEEGRINLNKIITDAYRNGFYYKPRTDFEYLKEHSEGLIISSACMAGEVSRALENDNYPLAKETVLKYKEIFGNNYYLECQSHEVDKQLMLNRKIVDLAKDTNTPWVITTDAHYIEKEGKFIHSVFVVNSKDDDDESIYEGCYMQTEEEARSICSATMSQDEIDVAFENTVKIAEQCVQVKLPIGMAQIPRAYLPQGFNKEIDYLRYLSYEGYRQNGIDKYPNKQEYLDRIEYELYNLEKMNYDRYLLNVLDQIKDIHRIGLGRGSSAGSIVCWLIGITKLDPIKYGLFFERFVDVGQVKQLETGEITAAKIKRPDIDTDCGVEERNRVFTGFITKYGEDKVVSIAAPQYGWAKNTIKDIARYLNIPFEIGNEITKGILSQELTEGVIENEIDIKYREAYPKLFEYASVLTGVVRAFSIHASGKIVADREVVYYAPVAMQDGVPVIMCDMDSVDMLMLLKSDLLGLRTLDVINDTLELIGKDFSYLDPQKMDLCDKNVFTYFSNGDTSNVFQFESDGMQNIMKRMKPNTVDDLIAINALYRPGSLKFIDNYIKRKHGDEAVEYLHPDLEGILSDTYGIIVYQEELIQIGRYAGLANPDLLRQATGKKDIKKLEKVKPELIDCLIKKQWTIQQIESLWNQMLDFARYSFNKSHSAAYALTAYQTMFLKVYHPLEFWCSVLNSISGKADKIFDALSAMKKSSIKINPMSYRKISASCIVEDNAVTLGTNVVKHLSSRTGEDIAWIKEINITKIDFIDFLIYNEEVVKQKIGKTTLQLLIKLGYFDSVANRADLLEIADQFHNGKGLKYDPKLKEKTKQTRIPLLKAYVAEMPEKKATIRDMIGWEIEYLGVPLSTFKAIPTDYAYVVDIEKTKYVSQDGQATYYLVLYGLNSGRVRAYQHRGTMLVKSGNVIQLLSVVTRGTNGEYKKAVIKRYKKLA
jgi:DNA polymerase-3 subunit alpha